MGDKAGYYSLSEWEECPTGSAVCGIRFFIRRPSTPCHNGDKNLSSGGMGSVSSVLSHHHEYDYCQDSSSGGGDRCGLKPRPNWNCSPLLSDSIEKLIKKMSTWGSDRLKLLDGNCPTQVTWKAKFICQFRPSLWILSQINTSCHQLRTKFWIDHSSFAVIPLLMKNQRYYSQQGLWKIEIFSTTLPFSF